MPSDLEPCPRCASCEQCYGRGVLPPVKVCANETCGREFWVQVGRSTKGKHHFTGVIYCSRLCAKSQAQRAWRRRQRQARTP